MESIWSNIQGIYWNNSTGWNILIGVIVFVGCWYWFDGRGEGLMSRREFVKRQAIDDTVNAIEERVAQGVYTREEANELLRELKKAWPVADLFPIPELLKGVIQKRIASGTHAPVELPGANPKPRPKHAFDKTAEA